MSLTFWKYHGLGNDFILIDNRDQQAPILDAATATQLCDRRFGVGADGVIFLLPSQEEGTDYQMRIFNSDGSEPEMCGNGIRCLAQFLQDLGVSPPQDTYRIQTLAGLMIPRIQEPGLITVDMGPPRLRATEIPAQLGNPNDTLLEYPLQVAEQIWPITCVSMGNPHCVTFVEDVNPLDLEKIGPLFEHHPAFPQRTNTEFVQILSPTHLRMRVWERGAGATLACGTGACAVLVAAVLTQRAEPEAVVELPGGPLTIHWDRSSQHVMMTGPAQRVFQGIYQPGPAGTAAGSKT
ncbi:MAG: diaminopimelate epimerase [Synechococcaceae cyanobacterium SM2_3_1]|nr:diaminopimelate epimerase [Synechococcaceae cyanobacterium SM2_3_1]